MTELKVTEIGPDLSDEDLQAATKSANIILLCFAVHEDVEKQCNHWLDKLASFKTQAKLLLVQCQSDKNTNGATGIDKVVNWAKEKGMIDFVQCSAKTNHGVSIVFMQAVNVYNNEFEP